MTKLKPAKLSPRMENGTLCWYEGDTFKLLLDLDLTDQDGAAITLEPEDQLTLRFWDRDGCQVRELTYTGGDVTENRISIEMDETLTAAFRRGKYWLDVQVLRENKTTVVKGSPVKVE